MSRASHQERLMTVVRGPHLSEKSHFAAEHNQVVLKVRKDATKAEIRQAVELLFEVEVEKVTVLNVKGKAKRFGANRGQQPCGTIPRQRPTNEVNIGCPFRRAKC